MIFRSIRSWFWSRMADFYLAEELRATRQARALQVKAMYYALRRIQCARNIPLP